jgi:galactokinase/mevalonate kinase-like predicted kinase
MNIDFIFVHAIKKEPMQTLLSVPENLVNVFNGLAPVGKESRFVLSDPAGFKIGSGGGTAWLLANHFRKSSHKNFQEYLAADKKIIIHAGGQSRRLPAYAPSGKILSPIPVFRWSRGQSISQNLLQLQLPLYEELMSAAPPTSNTLIASGDVLILPEQQFLDLPEADVICLGIWVDPHLASRHGVYFTPRENPNQLNFMLQKPDHSRIEALANNHLFLMDIGIWILSDKAINILMQKCGWNGSDFEHKVPDYYDMYSTFGTSLGTDPENYDKDIADLSVAILPLEKGEFYHYGTSLELITSTEKIQNRIKDQRAIWHHRVKPHPSLFVQNAVSEIVFNQENHHIWIENSHIPSSWNLKSHHVLTGIPENNWAIDLPNGICIDIIPIDEELYCLRPYAMSDRFGGMADSAEWLGMQLIDWLREKGGTLNEAGISPDKDIQNCALFPVLKRSQITETLVNWMLPGESTDKDTLQLWINCPRLSADKISAKANLKRLFVQRETFALKSLPKLAANHKRSVFYQTDLKELATIYAEHSLPFHDKPSADESPLILARDHMFRSEVLRLSGKDEKTEEKAAHSVLQNAIRSSVAHQSEPALNVFPDQIVWGRSPARLDLAGGWSDTPPYCLQSGGAVVNMAVNLNGQPPLQVFVRLSEQHTITLLSIDNGVSETITTYEELIDYTNVGSAFSIPRAALCLAGFHPNFCRSKYKSLQEQLQVFGGGIEISLLVAIPKGSGLGTSSILAATIMGALSDFCKLDWDNHAICHKSLILEQMLTTGGGWQDQYGGVFPGIKLLQSQPGLQTDISANWLPDLLFKFPEYRENWLLYYTGITRVAKNILSEIVRGMFLNDGHRLRIIDSIKEHAFTTFEAIQKCDYELTGKMVAHSWKLNNLLDPGTNTPEIQSVIGKIQDLTYGLKLLGAGGGGYLLICAKDHLAAKRIKEMLTSQPPNNRARFVDMTISEDGLVVSRS